MILTKFFDTNTSIDNIKTNYEYNNQETLRFYKFLLKNWFLVTCFHFCSWNMTEDLTGLPRNLSSDWLNLGRSCLERMFVVSRQMGEKEFRNDFLLVFARFSPANLLAAWGKSWKQANFGTPLTHENNNKEGCTAESAGKGC